MTTTEKIPTFPAFCRMLHDHDWFWEYATRHYRERGRAQWKRIQEIIAVAPWEYELMVSIYEARNALGGWYKRADNPVRIPPMPARA